MRNLGISGGEGGYLYGLVDIRSPKAKQREYATNTRYCTETQMEDLAKKKSPVEEFHGKCNLWVLVTESLEGPTLVFTLGERNAKFEEAQYNSAEVLEESYVILGVLFNEWLHLFVLDERHVCGQHHQRFRFSVLELFRPVPLPPYPLLLEEELVVVICQNGGRECPWSFEAGSIGVAAAEGVGTGEGNDFLVVETHSAEDGAEMVLFFRSIWETAIRGAKRQVAVRAAWAVWYHWALHLLEGADACEDPEIGVSNPWKLLCKKSAVCTNVEAVERRRVKVPLMGSRKSRAAFKPALAP
jgi:hypothetical protein